MIKILNNTAMIIFIITCIIYPVYGGEIKEYRFHVSGLSKTYGSEGLNRASDINKEAFLGLISDGLFLLPAVINSKKTYYQAGSFSRLHYTIGNLEINIRGSGDRFLTEISGKGYSIIYNDTEVIYPSIINDEKIFKQISLTGLPEPKKSFDQKVVEPSTGMEQVIFSSGIENGSYTWSNNVRFEKINTHCTGFIESHKNKIEYGSIQCEAEAIIVISVDPEKIENEISNSNKKILSYRFLKSNDGRRLVKSKEIQLTEIINSVEPVKIEAAKNSLLISAIKNLNEETNGVFLESFTKMVNGAIERQEIQSQIIGFSKIREKSFEVISKNGSTEIKLRAVLETPILEYSDE